MHRCLRDSTDKQKQCPQPHHHRRPLWVSDGLGGKQDKSAMYGHRENMYVIELTHLLATHATHAG
jgi:hypothetical protein